MAKILFRVSLFLLLFIWVYTAAMFGKLPETIPVHFGIDGSADGFGNRNMSWFLCAVATFVFILFSSVAKDLHSPLLNIPNSLRKNSALTKVFCQMMLFFCMLIFSAIAYSSIQVALGNAAKLTAGVEVLVAAMLCFMVGFFIYARWRQKFQKNAEPL